MKDREESLKNNENWKIIDRRYHEDQGVIASFDRRITNKYRLEYRYFTLDKWVEKIVKEKKKTVLDFGCGTGTATLRLLNAGIKTISVDHSLGMLKELEKKAKASKLNCYCIVCDVENLPFKDKTFEVLVCKGVLHHLPDISKAIKEQLRVMDANALLFISEPFKKHAWFSYPYYLTVNVIKAIFKLLRGTRVETLERPLDKSHLDVISGILDRTSHEHNIDYLVYWPIVCRYLPEFICYPFMLFLNRINKENDVGDSVIITARK